MWLVVDGNTARHKSNASTLPKSLQLDSHPPFTLALPKHQRWSPKKEYEYSRFSRTICPNHRRHMKETGSHLQTLKPEGMADTGHGGTCDILQAAV